MTNSASNSGDIFDGKKVRRLVELMKEHDLAEIDLKQGEQRIRLRRGAAPVVLSGGMPQVPQSMSSSPAPVAGRAPPAEDATLQTIKSPMVGTF